VRGSCSSEERLHPSIPDTPASTDLSIIILSWNTADLLVACLASLRENPYHGDHEIIVVDNGSSDGSADIASEAFPGIRLLRNSENLGYSAGNNIGLRAARGRFLLLLNSDIEVRPGALDRLVEFLESHPEAGAVGARHLNPDGSLQPSCVRFPTLTTALVFDTFLALLPPGKRHLDQYFMRSFDHETLREVDQIPGSCLLMPREVVQRIGLLNEEFWLYFNDVDLCKRILDAGYTVTFLPDAEVMHHNHASTSRFDFFVVQWHLNRVAYYRKYFGARGVLVTKLVGLYVALRQLWKFTVLRHAPRGTYLANVRFIFRGLAQVMKS